MECRRRPRILVEETTPLASHFGALDWSIVAAYLVLTTIIGAKLAGKQSTIRDFFLGGRTLPWYAVAGSIISTEISAVTFVSVPSIVFKPGGDFTYLQFGLIGSFLARLIVAYVLVPAYYQREIYSPYDYMGNQLGDAVKRVCSALFAFGGVLAQAARLYLTAVVLELVIPQGALDAAREWTGLQSLDVSILLMGFVAILWTLLGGMSTVIWTDVISFGVFVVGALVAIGVIVWRLDGGVGELIAAGSEAGKFHLIDVSTDPTRVYTIWIALFAVTLGNVGAYGTDQLMAQRMFCCRDAKSASRAVVWSSLGVGVTILVSIVGVGLFAYYRQHPLEGERLALVTEKADRVFPVFILDQVPPGLTGLVIAGIFAAAISGLDSIFVALAQTAMSTIYQPLRAKKLAKVGRSLDEPAEERRSVLASRILVVAFGVLLSAVAIAMDGIAKRYSSILDLALALAGYAQGGLLAAFLLAFLPAGRRSRDGSGLVWSVPLSVLAVFALTWQRHQGHPFERSGDHAMLSQWPLQWLLGLGTALFAIFVACELFRARAASRAGLPFPARALILAFGILLLFVLNQTAWFDRGGAAVPLAWPWFAPIGCAFALGFGWLLGNPKPAAASKG